MCTDVSFQKGFIYMKSIMQEASSIAKAIEQGWIKAGKPQEFSVKVFEEAQKNFLGFTTKSAKIALLFNDAPVQQGHQRQTHAPRTTPAPAPRQPQEHKTARPLQEKSPAQPERRPLKTQDRTEPQTLERRPLTPKRPEGEAQTVQPAREKVVWADDMKLASEEWMKNSLSLLNLPNTHFTVTTNGPVLSFVFESPLINNNERQRHLFRSFAFLLMQTLRHQFKKSCRNLRIIFTVQRHDQ
jgi:hypothetical protein